MTVLSELGYGVSALMVMVGQVRHWKTELEPRSLQEENCLYIRDWSIVIIEPPYTLPILLLPSQNKLTVTRLVHVPDDML